MSDHSLTQVSGPYAVTKDLIISKGATLTIEAGVQLNFQARVRLIVNGSLILKGPSPCFIMPLWVEIQESSVWWEEIM